MKFIKETTLLSARLGGWEKRQNGFQQFGLTPQQFIKVFTDKRVL